MSLVKKIGIIIVYLSLIDVNDNLFSFFNNCYFIIVNENVLIGGEVFIVVVIDFDLGINGDFVYFIISGNERGFFSIELI